ncbi:hypothetical protein ES703_14232 [subsurface metagenome]
MEWQRSYIERNLSLTANTGTLTIDLPKSAMLSELLLRIVGTNGANPNHDNLVCDAITKLEVIVNGSEVVKSLTGRELQALAFFNTKQVPHQWGTETAADTQGMDFPIQFGRFPGDLDYGLDCKKVTNPQLKITYNFSGAGLDATSLYSTSTFPVLDLLAIQVLDFPGAFPNGYIKSHEITTWSPTANSEVKRVELPVGNLFRRIMVRDYAGEYWMESGLAHTYLDLNVGKRQPFKMDTEDWMEMNRQLFGQIEVARFLNGGASMAQRDLQLGMADRIGGMTLRDLHILTSGGGGGTRWDFKVHKVEDGSVAADSTFRISAVGLCYHSMLCLPFDWPDDRFMLDSKLWSDIDLVLEAGSGAASVLPTLALVLEEIIKK